MNIETSNSSTKQSRRQRVGDYLMTMAKKSPGEFFSYQAIAKVLYDRKIMPKKDHAETKAVANLGASVRDYLQKKYNADLAVMGGAMRALITDEDKARHRLPKTRERVASAHRQHERSVAIVDGRKIRDEELKASFEKDQQIAKFGTKIAGLLPTRKPDRS